MKKHFKIKITGRVQGVWYRGSMQKKARQLGLSGFVRNETDGSVYAEAEGEEGKIKELVEWCRHGPELAKVEKVEVQEGAICEYMSFDILR
ncbi:MAG TPA: acylphosphatase [Bacteroidetes bacterium]|nr:acylphosphatase [Bacteroidota bacterium]